MIYFVISNTVVVITGLFSWRTHVKADLWPLNYVTLWKAGAAKCQVFPYIIDHIIFTS